MREPDITIQEKPIWFTIDAIIGQENFFGLRSCFTDSNNRIRGFCQIFYLDNRNTTQEVLKETAYDLTTDFLTEYMGNNNNNNIFIPSSTKLEIEDIILSKISQTNHYSNIVSFGDELPPIETICYLGGLGNKLLHQEVKFKEKE